jgi:hypothetical protein
VNKKLRWSLAVLAVAMLAAAVAAQGPAKVAGKWEMSWEGPQGPATATLVFEQDGENLKGSYTGPRGGEAPLTGSIKGKDISFSITRQTPRGEMKIDYKGKVDGDTIKGTMTTPRGESEWTAKRMK